MKKLSEKETERYQRNLWVEGFDEAMQLRLQESRIVVVGAGGLGSAVLQYCAAAGIGRIHIADFDTVGLSNLQRQILYTSEDLGLPKARTAAVRLRQINPGIGVTSSEEKITDENAAALIAGADAVLDCTDNYDIRYTLDAACRRSRTPLIYGTAEQGGGQVSVFHYQGAGGYADLYPEPIANPGRRIGVLSPLPGIIGSIQAMEVIKLLTRWGESLAGRLFVLDARNMSSAVYEI